MSRGRRVRSSAGGSLVALVLATAVLGCNEGDVQPPPLPAPPPVRDLSQAPVPRTLEEALTTLEKRVSADVLLEFAHSRDESIAARYHDTLGRWIRNNWGLWKRGPLYTDLRRRGLQHPDDMSGVILTSFWRQLHEEPLRVEEQINARQAFWKHQRLERLKGTAGPVP